MSKFITKRLQANMVFSYENYRQQYLTPVECNHYMLRDLGLPSDFERSEYSVVDDTDDRAIDNQPGFVSSKTKILIF